MFVVAVAVAAVVVVDDVVDVDVVVDVVVVGSGCWLLVLGSWFLVVAVALLELCKIALALQTASIA